MWFLKFLTVFILFSTVSIILFGIFYNFLPRNRHKKGK